MQALSFDGKSLEYFRIWIVNILLTIVTVGLYFPWAKVRTNRYFYANSKLDARNFEYHATGKQLFFGYLIAMGLFVLYSILQQISPRLGLILFVAFLLALPWIIWRSMIFGLRMTSFSNVRFGFAGKLGRAYLNYLIMPIGLYVLFFLLIVITVFAMKTMNGTGTPTGPAIILGVIMGIVTLVYSILAFAYLKKRNTTYQLSGTRYGQGLFQTGLKVGPLFKYTILGVLFGLIGFILFSVVAALILSAFTDLGSLGSMTKIAKENPEMIKTMLPMLMPVIAALYLGLILVFVLAGSYVTSRQRRYIYDNTTLDGKISFASTLKARSLAWVSLTNLIAIVLPLIAAGILFGIIQAAYGPGNTMAIILSAGLGLVTVFVAGLVFCWAKVRMARLMLTGTHVNTQVGFDQYVTEKQSQESSLGDQIGDAFNVDIGIGV
ncbi:MAG: DUF898 domain-containing protein [bacterium]|nr:DUF898 domain-containing protein [bacterium]